MDESSPTTILSDFDGTLWNGRDIIRDVFIALLTLQAHGFQPCIVTAGGSLDSVKEGIGFRIELFMLTSPDIYQGLNVSPDAIEVYDKRSSAWKKGKPALRILLFDDAEFDDGSPNCVRTWLGREMDDPGIEILHFQPGKDDFNDLIQWITENPGVDPWEKALSLKGLGSSTPVPLTNPSP